MLKCNQNMYSNNMFYTSINLESCTIALITCRAEIHFDFKGIFFFSSRNMIQCNFQVHQGTQKYTDSHLR